MTRQDVLGIGQSGRPHEFLFIAAQVLAMNPGDEEVRFLVAANLGRLGLGTCAIAHLDALSLPTQHLPDVTALRRALSGLPNDRMDPDTVIRTARANLAAGNAALREQLEPHLSAWTERARNSRWQRGLDGVLHRRDTDAPWIPGSGDIKAAALAWASSLRPPDVQYAFDAIIEGMNPPVALVEAWTLARSPVLGHTPRISVLVADPFDALDGLAQKPLPEILGDGRVEFFIGPEAGTRFASILRARVDVRLPRNVFVTPGVTRRVEPSIPVTLESTHALQRLEHERLIRACEAIYQGKDASVWRARFDQGTPLRVLICSSRYSTFVQHSARDQAGAWNALGHDAKVLLEPDDHSQMTALTYLRAVVEHRPDLITLINFPRSALGGALPPNVPFVCWIQDAMPHLFDAGVGAKATDLDAWAGHLFPELFDRFGYRPDKACPLPVLADARKFHTGEIPRALRDHFACDVACVTHHSETPGAMHERLGAQLTAAAPHLAPALPRLFQAARDAIVDLNASSAQASLARESATILRDVLGGEPDARTLTLIRRTYLQPLADRMLRHQALEWAASICRDRAWRLRLYGRGWETHPTLAPFAAGELSHGEELRAAYAGAGAHLHVSLTSIVHQRVLECLLTGGLCLPRVHFDVLSGCSASAIHALLALAPDADEPDRIGYRIDAHAPARHLMAIKAAFGAPVPDTMLWIRKAKIRGLRDCAFLASPDHDADRVLGGLCDVGFSTREGLARVLARAIDDPSWRWEVASRARAIVREGLTYDAAVPRLIRLFASDNSKERA